MEEQRLLAIERKKEEEQMRAEEAKRIEEIRDNQLRAIVLKVQQEVEQLEQSCQMEGLTRDNLLRLVKIEQAMQRLLPFDANKYVHVFLISRSGFFFLPAPTHWLNFSALVSY